MTWSSKSRQARGYGRDWELLRVQVLKRDQHLCLPCLKGGRYILAVAVDHIVQKGSGGTNDMTNLQSICRRCHLAKTLADNGRKPKARIGLDGYPVEE